MPFQDSFYNKLLDGAGFQVLVVSMDVGLHGVTSIVHFQALGTPVFGPVQEVNVLEMSLDTADMEDLATDLAEGTIRPANDAHCEHIPKLLC